MKNCIVLCVLACLLSSAAQASAKKQAAFPARLPGECGWTGGVAVQVGYDEARGVPALPGFLTQVLVANRQLARRAAEKTGKSVTAKWWTHAFLPYADNLVNVIIYRDAPRGADPATTAKEIRRVLAPGGVAVIRSQGAGRLIARFGASLSKVDDDWRLFTKPAPKDTDSWSHWLHGADGNPVAADTVSGPPRRVQWAAEPRRCRSHDVGLSMTGMVTDGRRLFYMADDGPVGMQDRKAHGLERWMLFSRDAHNGVLLWKKPVEEWGMRAWSPNPSKADGYGPWSINPRMIHKRVVACGDRLFVTLGFKAPVSVLEAATGRLIKTLPGTEFASEMVVVKDRVYLAADRAARRAGKYTANPANVVSAVDVRSGKTLWASEEIVGIKDNRTRGLNAELSRLHVTAAGGKVFYIDRGQVVALDASTGRVSWRFARPEARSLRNKADTHVVNNDWDLSSMLYSDGVLYFWQGVHPRTRQSYYSMTIYALSGKDGKMIWSKECCSSGFLSSLPSVYQARGLIWAEEASGTRQNSMNLLLGMDPKTGKVVKSYDMSPIFKTVHHHRCYPNKATSNYIIFSRNGLEYVDLRTGEMNINRWLRGVCQYGVMPANGLLYRPADPCACLPSARHNGYYAYSSAPMTDDHRPADSARLEKGPAYSDRTPHAPTTAEDWPVYRHDAMRSGASATAVSATPVRRWIAELGEPISAPTIAGGRLYVAAQDSRRIVCLDAKTGRTLWTFRSQGRVDSPPTLADGGVIFGTRDGFVCRLRQSDGALRWCFNANPAYRQIVSFERLESAWPIHGSVIVDQQKVMFAAGTCSYVDGGLFFYQLDARTGKVLRRITVRRDAHQDGLKGATGTAADLLVYDGKQINLRNISLAADDSAVKHTDWRLAGGNRNFPGAIFTATNGFLDDGMYDRDCWAFGRVMGKMICFNREAICLTQWVNQKSTWHNLIFDLQKHQYSVRLVTRSPQKAPARPKARRRGKQPGKAGQADRWNTTVPIRPGALTLTKNVVFTAGVPFTDDPAKLQQSIAGKAGGVLISLDLKTGKPAAKLTLPAPPVWDGMAAADGALFVCAKNGAILCYR